MQKNPSAGNASHGGTEPPGDGEFGLRLLKSTSIVSFMTLLSRVLGLVRDVVFARFFGATIVMDAFIAVSYTHLTLPTIYSV